jgi:hypothetical protein
MTAQERRRYPAACCRELQATMLMSFYDAWFEKSMKLKIWLESKEGGASLKLEERSKHYRQNFQLRAGSEAVPPTTEGVIVLE